MADEHLNLQYINMPDGTSLTAYADNELDFLDRSLRLGAAYAYILAAGVSPDRIVVLLDSKGSLRVTFQSTPTGKELAIVGSAWDFVGEHRTNIEWEIALELAA